ncbi:MAG: hypothetical protein ACI4U1_04405 [Anaerovoracaceae bacterium]
MNRYKLDKTDDNVQAAKWLTRDQLDSVDWLPADIEVLDWIRRYQCL